MHSEDQQYDAAGVYGVAFFMSDPQAVYEEYKAACI